MKKVTYLFLLFISLSWANSPIEKANSLYHSEQYEKAIIAYESILKANQHSVALYFNLANAHYKLNHVAPSIYYYEKALLLAPNDEDILNNIQFAQAMTIDEIKQTPQVGLIKIIKPITGIFHYNSWAWITVSLAGLIFIGFLIYYLSYNSGTKKTGFIISSICLLLLLFTLFSSWFEKGQSTQEQPAIIFDLEVSLKEEPKNDAEYIVQLHEGSKVYIKEQYNDWAKVELLNGTEGWLTTKSIKPLK